MAALGVFCRLAIGDVTTDGVDDALLQERCGEPLQPLVGSVRRAIPVFEVDELRSGRQGRQRLGRRRAVIRVDEFHERRRSQHLVGQTEHLLPGGIDPHEVALEGGDAKQIQGEPKEPVEIVAGSLPLDEHADLAAHGGHHSQQIGGGLANVAAEELHRALHAAPFHDRQCEGGMEPGPPGRRGPRKIVVAGDVGYPGGRTIFPNAPGQADAPFERGHRGGRGEFLQRESRGMPRAGAAHALSRPIDLPDGAALPAERVAHRLDHARRRLLERWRFGECPRGFEENPVLAGQVSGGCSVRSVIHDLRCQGSITLRLLLLPPRIAESQRIERWILSLPPAAAFWSSTMTVG